MLSDKQKTTVEGLMQTAHALMAEVGEVRAVYFLVVGDNVAAVPPLTAGLEIGEETSKRWMAEALAFACKLTGADLAVMIDEVWLAEVKPPPEVKSAADMKKWHQEGYSGPRPSEHPNRKEGLMAITMSPGGEVSMLSSEIHRDADGKPHLTEAKWSEYDRMETRMLKPWATDA